MSRILLILISLYSFNCSASVTQWIDFKLENGHVKVPVTVAGVDTYGILDTGAQVNAINKAFVNKNKLSFDKGREMRVKGVFGVENKPTYNNVPINFFGMQTQLDNLVQINLGIHKNGILFGSGFFDKFVVQLDYPNEKMRLMTHESVSLKKFQNIEIKRQKGTGMPIVKIHLPDDKSIWLVLDTGNSGGMIIDRKVAEKMGWLKNIEKVSSISMGANAISITENFRIPSLNFGPYELENVLVSIPAEGSKTNLTNQYQKTGSRIKGRKVQGIIGYDVLKHFLITIDYKKGLAHIGLPEEA